MIKKLARILFFVFSTTFLWLLSSHIFPASTLAQEFVVCAIGDSHVEPGSLFLRELQEALGDGYIVEAHGRRGWTSRRWLRYASFGEECRDADIVLISLGGNDEMIGIPLLQTKRNIEELISQLPPRILHIFHMGVPRFVLSRVYLSRDFIHMNRQGAEKYAMEVAESLFFP